MGHDAVSMPVTPVTCWRVSPAECPIVPAAVLLANPSLPWCFSREWPILTWLRAHILDTGCGKRALQHEDTASFRYNIAFCKPPSPQATIAEAVPASLCIPKYSAGLLPQWDPLGRAEIWLRAQAYCRTSSFCWQVALSISGALRGQPELLAGKLGSSVKCRQSFALFQSEKHNGVKVCPCGRSRAPSWSPPVSGALPSDAHSLVGACQLTARASSVGGWVGG